MNKRILLIGGGALLVSVLAVVSVNWYLKSLEYSPALSEEQMAEAASRLRGSAPTTSATAAIPALPTSRAVRLAIGGLGLPNDAVNREVADLVVANLTGASGLELVERQALDLALREMSLSLSGLVRAQDAIRVGKLVRADWFLLGNTVRLTQTNFIVARLVDAKSGVIQNLALVGDVDQPLLVAKALASFTRRAREAAAQPDVKEFLALGHFADAGVNSRQAAFPAQLRSYLMSAYRGSRITLLEREYVDALLQEVRLDLAGLTTESPANDVRPLQSAFWIVEGLFQSQETSGFEVEVNLRITRAFDRATQQTFRGKPDENLFRQIKSAIDVALSDTKRGVYPTKLSESRLQMRAGKDLYALATGGKPMEILPPGMSLGGYAPQEPSMRRRNLEEAIRAFQTVLLLEPDNLEAKFNLAVCCHEESVGRIEEARNQFRELASGTNHGWSQKAIFSLGETFEWEDSQESAKWYNLAVTRSQNPSEADYAKQKAAFSVAHTIERNARTGMAPGSKDIAVLIEQLKGSVSSAESVMRGKGGGIDAWYGLKDFADAFGERRTAAEQIAGVLPMLRTNFPALVPHLLGSAVTFLPDTNSPIYAEFLQSLDLLRARPDQLLDPEMYFKNLLLTTYDWCLDHKLYGLAAELVSAKRSACERIPQLKMDARDGVRLGFAYLKSQDYTNALKAFEELGDTPVVMAHNGVWGHAFTPFLPAQCAAACRAKLGLPTPTDDRHFELGTSCLRLGADAVFVVEPAGLWLGVGHQLHHLTLDLQTNLTVSLPGNSYPCATALCLDGERIWIATAGDGLIEYNKTSAKCRQYTMKDGLLMDELASLHLADDCLWIGYGAQNHSGESRGGLGRLDFRSHHFSSFTPALTPELIPPAFATGGRVADPADRPPRNPVVLIGSWPARQIVLNVAREGVRRYLPDKDQWTPLPFQEQTSVHSFAANSECLITGLSVARYDVDLQDFGPGRTNLAVTTRKNLTGQEVAQIRADSNPSKKISFSRMVWRPGLGIHNSSDGSVRIVADDGSLPEYPQLLASAGSDVIVAGKGYIVVYDLKQMRVRKLARIPAASVDSLQAGAGFLWVQFDRHLYRVALSDLR